MRTWALLVCAEATGPADSKTAISTDSVLVSLDMKVEVLFFQLFQLFNHIPDTLVKVLVKGAVIYLGIARFSVVDALREFIVNLEELHHKVIGCDLVCAWNQLLVYETLGEQVTYYITDVLFQVSATCHSCGFLCLEQR